MPRLRTSIARLMISVVAFAVVLAALSRPTRLWAALFLAATVAILVTATIRWASSRHSNPGYWRGFSIAGWIAYVMHFGAGQTYYGHDTRIYSVQYGDMYHADNPSLAALDLLHDLGETIGAIPRPAFPPADPMVAPPPPPETPTVRSYWLDDRAALPYISGAEKHPPFLQIGYLTICLLAALAGGGLGSHFERRKASVDVAPAVSARKEG